MVVRWKRVVAAVVIGSLLVTSKGTAETAAYVEMRSDTTLAVEVVAWRPSGQVLLVFGDGSDWLVRTQKIRKVVDMKGADRTRFVMEEKGKLGEFPEGYTPPKNPWKKAVVTGLAVGAGFFLILGALYLTGGVGGTD